MDLSHLISHWRFEEAGTALREDAHGSFDLEPSNSIAAVTGKLGSAADLGGFFYSSSDAFKFGDESFEFNGWVNFDTLLPKATVFCQGFGEPYCSYRLYTDGANLIFQVSSDGASWAGATSVTSLVSLSTGVKYFFRCWHDADSNEIGIKVNSEAIVTAPYSAGIYQVAHGDISNGLYIGLSFGDSSGLNPLDGWVDSFSVWGRVLTEEEGNCVWNANTGLDYPWPCVTAGVPAETFFEAIKRPTLTPILLAEIGIGVWCRAWLVDGTYTNTYKVSAEREDVRGKTFSLNITSVKWNLFTDLEEQTSAADVDANPGSWFCDGESLWVNPPVGEDIFSNTVQAFVTFYFADHAKILNDIFWDPRLAGVPSLSQRIEPNFGGVGQVGGGNLTLKNEDGYFNQMQDFQWYHGNVTLRLGIDLPINQVMDWQDYQVIATWNIREWRRDETSFTLMLEEPKARVKTKVPFETFTRDDFPNIEDNLIGQPIPIAYGPIYGASPVLVDPGAKQFKVAGHAIKSFDGVRVKTSREETRTITTAVGDWKLYSGSVYRYYLANEEATNVTFGGTSLTKQNSVADVTANAGSWTTSENFVYVNPSAGQTISSGVYAIAAKKNVDGWATSNFATVDTTNGLFTLGNDWSVGVEVSVDFRGKVNSAGVLISNPADIVADLLDTVGEDNVDAASFAEASARYNIGRTEAGDTVTILGPSVYLTETKEVLEIIGLINELANAYLYSDELGRFHMGAFLPEPGDSLPLFTDLDLLDFEERSDATEILSKFITSFQERKQDEFAQIEEVEKTENQYIAGQPQAVIEKRTVELAEERDAEYWTRRQLQMRGFPAKAYNLTFPWNALTLRPGDQIHIQSEKRQIDEVLEILEVRRDLTSKQVMLTVGNLRALNDTPGFWVADDAVLPTRFQELTGYGVGDLAWNSAWDPQIKRWARQNVGYWTDANGFADTDDPDSYVLSVWV